MRGARAWTLVALVALVARGAGSQVPVPHDQTGTPREGRPDVRYERVGMEVVAGTYAGLGGYFVGRGVGTVATMMMSAEHEKTRDNIVNSFGMVGGAFAIGGAVYAIGDMGSETGSFTTTMLGVGAGAGVGWALSKLVFKGRMSANQASAKRKWLLATLECSLPAIGGTIAFNSSRRWER
jgi:hypothetical protein